MIIGIDPGITGAISFFDNDGELLGVEDMPTKPLGGKRQVDSEMFCKIIDARLINLDTYFDPFCSYWPVAYLEKVHAMPGQGVVSMFNFGMGYGAVQGVLASREVDVVLVTPQAWKKYHGLIGKDKDSARLLAQRLYPQASLSRKKDIGRADAMLIGDYGVQQQRIGA